MALFTLFEVPYFNALTAGQFDASATIDANMPVSHAAYSLQTLALFQSPGQTARPDVLKWPDVQEAGVREGPPPGECDTWDLQCHALKVIGSDTVKDYAKRTGLVLLAIVLIAIAIVSMR
jgi:hypothetical protein